MFSLYSLFHTESKKRQIIPESDDDWPKSWKVTKYKKYVGAKIFDFNNLGAELVKISLTISDTLLKRKSHKVYNNQSFIELNELHTLLKLACGETGVNLEDRKEKKRRTYASAGAMFPIEIYFLLKNAPKDLVAGLYHYRPDTHQIELLDNDSSIYADVAAKNLPVCCDDSQIIFFITGRLLNVISKYGNRGYIFTLLEAGQIITNLSLVAESINLPHSIMGGFDDREIESLLDIDGISEVVLSVLVVGKK